MEKREIRYRLLLDTMSHGVQENDREGTIIYSNNAHHRILGYEPGELKGRKIWDLLPTAVERTKLKEYFLNLVKEQPPPRPYQATNLTKTGEKVALQIDWNYLREPDGELKGFISVITDITERNKTEYSLRSRTQSLATLLEVSKSLSATLDLHNVLQTSVDGVTRLIGLDTAAVYLKEDRHLHLWATTPPLPSDFPDELRKARITDHPHIRKAINTGEPVLIPDMVAADLSPAERQVMELRNLRTVIFIPLIVDTKPTGVFIAGSVNEPSPVTDAKIDLSLTLANLAALTVRNAQLYGDSKKHAEQLGRMLTERIEAEKEKAELQEKLQQSQKMEAIGRLAGGVAHDFNNMLGVIIGYADLALTRAVRETPLHNDLSQILDAAKRSASLTRQLLAFARQQTITPVPLDLNEVIGNMLQMLRRLIGEDIDLAWLPGDNLGPVKIDTVQVDQILANLCINARDAITTKGKITIETTGVSFDEEFCTRHPRYLAGEYVMIAVSDNGAGMDRETLANIFEPYFSTKRTLHGTGLGLATVYGIVKQNHGFINVYSEPGQGTTFKIYLPRFMDKNAAITDKVPKQALQGGSETILLVEDEIKILKLGEEMLRSLGYQVFAAGSPTEALSFAEHNGGPVDLLITDVVMPEMNGCELAHHLTSIWPGVKTLYISGYTANVIAHHGVLHEGVLLLQKPFTIDELALKVRQAMDKKTKAAG